MMHLDIPMGMPVAPAVVARGMDAFDMPWDYTADVDMTDKAKSDYDLYNDNAFA